MILRILQIRENEMADQKDFDPLNFPDELKRARNKLLFASFIIIFISIFEPVSPGFLSNFSIKVRHYPHLAIWLLIVVYSWFFIRYLSLLSYHFSFLNFFIAPFRSMINIRNLWNEFRIPLYQQKQKIHEFEKKYPLDSEEYRAAESLYHHIREEQQRTKTIKSVKTDSKNPDDIKYLDYLNYEQAKQKEHTLSYRQINLINLGLMDVAFPISLAVIVLFSITFNYYDLVDLIDSSKHIAQTENPNDQ